MNAHSFASWKKKEFTHEEPQHTGCKSNSFPIHLYSFSLGNFRACELISSELLIPSKKGISIMMILCARDQSPRLGPSQHDCYRSLFGSQFAGKLELEAGPGIRVVRNESGAKVGVICSKVISMSKRSSSTRFRSPYVRSRSKSPPNYVDFPHEPKKMPEEKTFFPSLLAGLDLLLLL